jgi:hypothetical protein
MIGLSGFIRWMLRWCRDKGVVGCPVADLASRSPVFWTPFRSSAERMPLRGGWFFSGQAETVPFLCVRIRSVAVRTDSEVMSSVAEFCCCTKTVWGRMLARCDLRFVVG